MFKREINRRDILKGGASMSGMAMLMATGGCEAIRDAIANRPIRHSASSALAATDLAIYDDAVALMKGLSSSDPRSWDNQAQIHQSFCPHGNWFFLPWHRAYLFYFEQICRELTGEQEFALPYWNWQTDRSLPAPYWAGNLDHSPRTASSSSQAGLSYIGASVLEGILDLTNFEQFASYASTALRGGSGGGYGELESTPHNLIHGFVGGTMGGFLSPLDPIFWSHHNMIDCMWDRWNNARGNLNTSDTAWTQFDLSGMFVDKDGNPASMTCGLTTILPLISYRFGGSSKGILQLVANPTFSRAVLEKGGNIRHKVTARSVIARNLSVRQGRNVTRTVEATDAISQTDGRIIVQLSDLSTSSTSSLLRIFINKPDATNATSIEDPHYGGTVGFFLPEMARMGMDYYVDVTDTVERLQKVGMMSANDKVSVTLVAGALEKQRAATINVKALDLVTTPAAQKGK